MNEDQSNPVLVVTGASRGLGRAAAQQLAAAGARLVLPMRSAATADAARQTFGDNAEVVVTDLACPDCANAILDAGLARWGHIDGLVNNAGIIEPIGGIAEIDPDIWELSLKTNLTAPFRLVQAFLNAGSRASPRRIVNISSGAAHHPIEGWAAYCAAKAGLAMLTRSVHLEYENAGILAFGLAPGLVDTDMQGTIRASGVNDVSRLPRSALRPAAEAAAAIVWLLSGAGDDLAGDDIDIRDRAFRIRSGLPAL